MRSPSEFTQNPVMETKRDLVSRATELPLHSQDEVECRRCGVHCDKIVYPAACVERGCQREGILPVRTFRVAESRLGSAP